MTKKELSMTLMDKLLPEDQVGKVPVEALAVTGRILPNKAVLIFKVLPVSKDKEVFLPKVLIWETFLENFSAEAEGLKPREGGTYPSTRSFLLKNLYLALNEPY